MPFFACTSRASVEPRAPAGGHGPLFLVCSFLASRHPGAQAVGCCLSAAPARCRPRGILGLQLPGIVCCSCLFLFVLHEIPRLQLSGDFCSFGCSFPASRDPGAPAVGYSMLYLSVSFRPLGILGLQLSGIVCVLLFVIFGRRGLLGLSCQVLSVIFVYYFRV